MRPDARTAAAFAGLLLAALAPACPAQEAVVYTLPPPDPGALSPAARRMAAEFARIVANRDLAALHRHIGPDARKTGDSENRPLREVWRAAPSNAALWAELEDILRLGGVERVDPTGARTWCAPYTTCLSYQPEGAPYDATSPFETLVVTGTGVALRSAPHADAPVLARVDDAVLRINRDTTYECWEGAWRCATWRGRPAYVSSKWVREVLAPSLRIGLDEGGDWQIEDFAIGD